MSQFQRRFVIGSIVYICLYVPIFFFVWLNASSRPADEGDRLMYIVAPFHVFAGVSGIIAQLLVIRHILKSPMSSRWRRDAWLAFVVFAPQIGAIAWVIRTADETRLVPTTEHR